MNDFLQVIYLTPTGTQFSVIGHYLGSLLRINLSSFHVTVRYLIGRVLYCTITMILICRWDIPALLEKIPKLGAVIDLTNTARYYNPAVRTHTIIGLIVKAFKGVVKNDIVVEQKTHKLSLARHFRTYRIPKRTS